MNIVLRSSPSCFVWVEVVNFFEIPRLAQKQAARVPGCRSVHCHVRIGVSFRYREISLLYSCACPDTTAALRREWLDTAAVLDPSKMV